MVNWIKVSLGLMLLGAVVFGAHHTITNYDGGDTYELYEYEIKAEQVYDNTDESTQTATPISELSETEQQMLYDAFKKNDHFLDGSSVIIQQDEKIETLDPWKVVNINGVSMLVMIDGPETIIAHESPEDSATLVMGLFLCLLFGFTGLLITLEGLLGEALRNESY